MLQIIGLLGCLYLLVKGFELISISSSNPRGKLSWSAVIGAALAILGSVFFAYMFLAQATASTEQLTPTSSSSQSFVDCLKDPATKSC